MFGDGFPQGSPVWWSHNRRPQPASGTTVSDTGIFRSAAAIRANSPIVRPRRTGIVWGPVNDRRSGSIGGPSTTWPVIDRESTRLNSSHSQISYAVFCFDEQEHSVTGRK